MQWRLSPEQDAQLQRIFEGETTVDDAEPVIVLAAMKRCADAWEGDARLVGNVRAKDISRACAVAIRALAA
jgi:hypothetical protein